MNVSCICDFLRNCALTFPDRLAFQDQNGKSRSFSQLLAHSGFVASELGLLFHERRAAVVMGEVNYSTLTATLGCLMAGFPVIPAEPSMTEDELTRLLIECEAGVIFCGGSRLEKAQAVSAALPSLFVIGDFEELLDQSGCSLLPTPAEIYPDEPAFMFLTSREKKAAVLSHKNICSSLLGVAKALDISSYTFLSPAVWGGAFDCVAGVLLPLSAGCTIVCRGERRGTVRAIMESGASALVCTPERLRILEKALRSKSTKVFGKARTCFSDLVGAALRAIGMDAKKRAFRRIRGLMGNNLRLIICGGAYPDRDCIRQFTNWGFDVYNCYFLAECGIAALSAAPGERPVPLMRAELSTSDGELGEIMLAGESVAEAYFGGKPIPSPFHTGDIGRICEDGTLEINGKRRTMLISGNESVMFPEEFCAVLCRSRYISRCSVSGRFDTSAGILVSAAIVPDYKAVGSVLGAKYSNNRLNILIRRELDRLEPQLPHKINDFTVVAKQEAANQPDKKRG